MGAYGTWEKCKLFLFLCGSHAVQKTDKIKEKVLELSD